MMYMFRKKNYLNLRDKFEKNDCELIYYAELSGNRAIDIQYETKSSKLSKFEFRYEQQNQAQKWFITQRMLTIGN